MNEEWKPVVGHEDSYEVSDRGNVRNIRSGRVKKFGWHKDGYRQVTIKGKTRTVHRLVAQAFLGPSDLPIVRHLDGNPRNNVVANLAWGTYSDNVRDSIEHGTYVNGNAGITHCKNGHEFTVKNTYVTRAGARACRACQRDAQRRYEARKKRDRLDGLDTRG